MKSGIIARRYAKALINEASALGLVDEVADDLKTLTSLYTTDLPTEAQAQAGKKLRLVLVHPRISPDEKYRFLDKVIGTEIKPLTLKFIRLIINKKRFQYLPEIADSYYALKDILRGLVKVKVMTPFALTSSVMDRLQKKIGQLTGKEIILSVEKVPSLLGGIAIQIGDTVFDGSVRARLKSLEKQLLASV